MKHLNAPRALVGVAAAIAAMAAATAIVAPAASAASAAPAHTSAPRPGLLIMLPNHGSLDDNPIAHYLGTKACPAADRAYGLINLDREDGSFVDVLSTGFTPASKLPTGTLDAGSLEQFVFADDLTSGYYRADLTCYNADFTESVIADQNYLKIDTAKNTWRTAPLRGLLPHATGATR